MSRIKPMSKTELFALPLIEQAVKEWLRYRDTPQELHHPETGAIERRLPVTGPSDCALFVSGALADAGLTIVKRPVRPTFTLQDGRPA